MTPEEKQRAYKRRWERENAWRYKDNCPRCGGLKWKRKKLCWDCRSFDTSAHRSY